MQNHARADASCDNTGSYVYIYMSFI